MGPVSNRGNQVINGVNYAKEKVWPFTKETGKIVSSSLKVGMIVEGSPLAGVAGKVKGVLSSLGVLALVNAFFTFFGVPFEIKEIVDKAKIGDSEGVLRASVGTVMTVADGFGDVAGGVTSISALGAAVAAPALAFFMAIGLPLAIAGLGYSVVKGTYDLVRNGIALHEIKKLNQVAVANRVDQVKAYIDEKLGVATDADNNLTFDACHVSICERRSDKKVVRMMQQLRQHLEENPDDVATADLALEHMKGIMWRKIAINTGGVVANAALCAALVASLIIPVMSPIAIPVVGGVKAGVGIAKAGLNIGLEKWHKDWCNNNPTFAAPAA